MTKDNQMTTKNLTTRPIGILLVGLSTLLTQKQTVRESTMIKCIETSAGTIFTQHIVRIVRCSDGCRIHTTDGECTSVCESYDNVMFQICNNRKPEENEL